MRSAAQKTLRIDGVQHGRYVAVAMAVLGYTQKQKHRQHPNYHVQIERRDVQPKTAEQQRGRFEAYGPDGGGVERRDVGEGRFGTVSR